MKTIRVLYGFVSEKIIDGIEGSLKTLGYKAEGTMRPTKQMLKEYVDGHPGLDAVIIKEYLDGGGKYGVEELLDLADESSVNIVVILGTEYRGKDSMKDLYAAGILNAVFSDGKKGVDPDLIAELVAYGRTRRQAREYYRIDRKTIKKRYLTQDEFDEMYKYLADTSTGTNLIERFVAVSRWVSSEQLALFLKAMPKDAIDALKRYREYYEINARLYRAGLVDTKLRCPRDARVGLPASSYGKKDDAQPGKKRSAKNQQSAREPEEIEIPKRAAEPVREEEPRMVPMSNTDFRQYISEQRQGIYPDAGSVPPIAPRVPESPPPQYIQHTEPPVATVAPMEATATPPPVPASVPPAIDYETMDVDSLIGMLG